MKESLVPIKTHLKRMKGPRVERDILADFFEGAKWYHCVRHDGLKTNGVYDVDSYKDHYGLNSDYSGKTVLDVGCSDGYFSLLFKERNALRVCALDSNKYDGTLAIDPSLHALSSYSNKYKGYQNDFERFKSVYDAFGLQDSNKLKFLSKLKNLDVEFINGSVYDLSEVGTFDITFCSALLEHLKDPIKAIENISIATRELAIIAVSSAYRPNLVTQIMRQPVLKYRGHISGGSFFEISELALKKICEASGFRKTKVISRFKVRNLRLNVDNYHFVLHAYK